MNPYEVSKVTLDIILIAVVLGEDGYLLDDYQKQDSWTGKKNQGTVSSIT